MALAACVYLSLMGKNGLRRIGELNYHKAHYAANEIDRLKSYSVVRERPFFNEFVVRCPQPVQAINDALVEAGIIGGYDLGRDYPHLKNHMLVAVTEMNRKEEIDAFVQELGKLS
jgi:glycine dehydrogenase subunit 1